MLATTEPSVRQCRQCCSGCPSYTSCTLIGLSSPVYSHDAPLPCEQMPAGHSRRPSPDMLLCMMSSAHHWRYIQQQRRSCMHAAHSSLQLHSGRLTAPTTCCGVHSSWQPSYHSAGRMPIQVHKRHPGATRPVFRQLFHALETAYRAVWRAACWLHAHSRQAVCSESPAPLVQDCALQHLRPVC